MKTTPLSPITCFKIILALCFGILSLDTSPLTAHASDLSDVSQEQLENELLKRSNFVLPSSFLLES